MKTKVDKGNFEYSDFTQMKFETTVADRAFGGILYVKSQKNETNRENPRLFAWL